MSAETDPKVILATHAGAKLSRRCRASGATVTLYDTREQTDIADSDCGRWATVCETHGSLVFHDTRALGAAALSHPDWCEECQVIMNEREQLEKETR